MSANNNPPLLTLTSPLGDGVLHALALCGEEMINDLFSFTVEAVSTQRLAAADMLGQPLAVTLNGRSTSARVLHGVVTDMARGAADGWGRYGYTLTLRPSLWLLSRAADCRVFQNEDVIQITEALLAQRGGGPFRSVVSDAARTARPYCVQYNETDYDFLRRIWFDAGVFFYFEHQTSDHTLVLADAPAGYADCPDSPLQRRASASGLTGVDDWRLHHRLSTGRATLGDYNFETPQSDLTASCAAAPSANPDQSLEIYAFPGGHPDKAEGEASARRRMEGLECAGVTAHGQSNCVGLLPGGRFLLADADDDEPAFVVTHLRHVAQDRERDQAQSAQAEYRNEFTCMPADRPCRAAPLPKPRIAGVQTARVVGPEGEEVFCDHHGRVRLQFPWDRLGAGDDHSSCWVRVAQTMSHGQWGGQALPRVGAEAIVSFVDGDPDRPMVTATAPNGQNTLPWPPPEGKAITGFRSRSTPGGGAEDHSAFYVDDTRDAEKVVLRAQRDCERDIGANDILRVAGDRMVSVGASLATVVRDKDARLSVEQGDYQICLGKGDISMRCDQGAVRLTAATEITLSVGGNALVISRDGVSITANAITLQGAQDVTVSAPTASLSGADTLTLRGGLVRIN